jgi:uncharacterized phage protein (TIGR02218 family)
MSYAIDDASVQDGKPIFLYEFINGAVTTRLNSSPETVTYNTFDWAPSPLNHSAVTQSNEIAKDPIKLELPRDDGFASAYLGYPPEVTVSLTIFRKHLDSADVATHWKGRLVGSSTSGQIITIECESIFTSLKRPGLRAVYQKDCRHVLYGNGCRLDKADFEVAATVSAVAANVVTVVLDDVEDLSLDIPKFYLGGMLKHNDVFRYITSHSGSQLTLSRALSDIEEDDAIAIYPGCDRTRLICALVFANLDNHGGFPWIPSRNPFQGAI